MSQSQDKIIVMECYMKEYERMALILTSQEFYIYIAQYQEDLNRLYWESAAHYAHMLPQNQKCSETKRCFSDMLWKLDTKLIL